MRSAVSGLGLKAIALLVLLFAAFVLFKIVLGFVATVVWVIVGVLAVAAVVWAIRIL